MKYLRKIPPWFIGGLLYGLSWPIFSQPNLSFLAWFAFVPLFIYLEKNRHSFWKFLWGSYGMMLTFGLITGTWLLNFPRGHVQIGVVILLELFYMSLAMLPLYFLQKKMSFSKSLWLLPFIYPTWEWIFRGLDFAMGTHLMPYSQSSNIWLVQFIDLTGMWGISFWVVLFNVLIWKAFKQVNYAIGNRRFYLGLAKISLLMLLPPLLYSAYVFNRYEDMSGASINVSLIPTQYSAEYLSNRSHRKSVVERTLHRTDSLAFALMAAGKHSDLYVWPETGTNYWLKYSNLGDLLQEAVNDYESALITGCVGIPATFSEKDKRGHVSGVLISNNCDPEQTIAPQYHHKTALTPGNESIPYHHYLAKIPGFPIPETDPHFWKKGTGMEPVNLTTWEGRQFKVGVSLCYEQWYPDYWAALARNGADFYVHMAGEGWYGYIGFQQFMANVTRLRCIENRHSVARCANVGYSLFIDPLGRFYDAVPKGSLDTVTAWVRTSGVVTPYARLPTLFPVLCLLGAVFGFLVLRRTEEKQLRRPGPNKLRKPLKANQ